MLSYIATSKAGSGYPKMEMLRQFCTADVFGHPGTGGFSTAEG